MGLVNNNQALIVRAIKQDKLFDDKGFKPLKHLTKSTFQF